ncbi:MAG: AMP-binding protein [Planctomycetales bacterium]|nr:AMP-binding protein [Planctomycetales bacterium]
MNQLPNYPQISDAERFPLLTPSGRELLHALREHPQAPIWNWPNGEQLDEAGLDQVRQFAASLDHTAAQDYTAAQDHTAQPPWLPSLVEFCLEAVPFYRRHAKAGTAFDELPSCTRDDLANAPWDFVPDSQPLDRLIVFSSSGTTGHPAQLPTHPVAAACGVPLLERVLADVGVRFPRGSDDVAIASITDYPGAYSTANLISYLDEAGYIRVNLQPDAWKAAGDSRGFLDAWRGAVLLSDPVALDSLTRHGLGYPPRAIVSSIATLTDGLTERLRERFGCPVLDLYAMTEAGIVAVKAGPGHRIVPGDLYVEILDEHDRACPPGVRGEVTLTGGRNPFCPLLRYRTGDFASLRWEDDELYLCDLEGRDPVLFAAPDGGVVHSMQVSRAMRTYPLAQYSLWQAADGRLTFTWRGSACGRSRDATDGQLADAIRGELLDLFGKDVSLELTHQTEPALRQRKVVQYRSERPRANHVG